MVGNQNVDINFDKNTQTLYCSAPVKTVTCMTGYYFALKAFYPEAEVILNRK